LEHLLALAGRDKVAIAGACGGRDRQKVAKDWDVLALVGIHPRASRGFPMVAPPLMCHSAMAPHFQGNPSCF